MAKPHQSRRSPPNIQVGCSASCVIDACPGFFSHDLPAGPLPTVALPPEAAGTTVEFRLRGADCELLGPSFKYEVLQLFGVEGRAVAFRPCHAPQTLVLAFRGTRVDHSAAAAAPATKSSSPSARRGAAPQSEDIRALLNSSMVDAKWLPNASMRVHAGVLGHHNDLWTSSAAPRAAGASGARGHGGLGQFFARTVLPHPPTNILFVGLSLGAALAQISALRLAAEYPHLAARSAVFGLGALQFANPAVASHFRQVFGSRAAQLVTTRRNIGKPPANATWWVHDTSAEAAAELEARIAAATAAAAAGQDCGSGCVGHQLPGGPVLRQPAGAVGRGSLAACAVGAESAAEERGSLASRVSAAERVVKESASSWLVADPITAAFVQTAPMHNIFTIPAGASGCSAATRTGNGRETEAEVHLPLRPLPARPGGLTAQPAALAALMTGCIGEQHAMRLDYLALHLSRHYRAGLRGAHLAYRSSRPAGRGGALAFLNRQSSAGGMKRGRMSTQDHLDSMQPPPMRVVTSWPKEDEDELFDGPPLPAPAPVGKATCARGRSSTISRPEVAAPVQPASAAAMPCVANQTEATRARGSAIAEAATAASCFQLIDSALSDGVGTISTGIQESGGLRRSARIEGLLRSVVRVGWGARLAHRIHKEAHVMCSLDRQFSDLISQQPPALPQADASAIIGEPGSTAPLRGSARQSLRSLAPRPSEDLSYWGF